jgi:hypothetical protein
MKEVSMIKKNLLSQRSEEDIFIVQIFLMLTKQMQYQIK